jgi:hypothetical protein
VRTSGSPRRPKSKAGAGRTGTPKGVVPSRLSVPKARERGKRADGGMATRPPSEPGKEAMTSITDWDSFVASSRSFFDANRGSPMFRLIRSLDELYRVVHARGPFPNTEVERDLFLHRCFVTCHRAMLSAATITASGLPQDGPANTRRALEAAKVCLAIKAHPGNFDLWQAAEVRAARWKARAAGDRRRSPPVNPQYKDVATDPFYQEIQSLIGVLSDAAVHFTPEYFGAYLWERSRNPDGSVKTNVGVAPDAVPYRLFQLVEQHLFIVRVFDYCLDGKLLADADIARAAREVVDLLRDLLVLDGLPEMAKMVERGWSFLARPSG